MTERSTVLYDLRSSDLEFAQTIDCEVYLLIDKRTVHRVVHCMQSYSNQGAPLLELSWYPFSKYTNFVADVNLAST